MQKSCRNSLDAKKELKDFGISVEVAICNTSDAGEFIRKIDAMIQEESVVLPSRPQVFLRYRKN